MKSNLTDPISSATRTGKIARLPQEIRQQLNERLADGECGQQLVAWLNENEVVRKRLETYYDGRPITEQNLSDWKQGGFRDWQRHQQTRGLVREFLCEAEEMAEEMRGNEYLEFMREIPEADLLGGNALLERMADVMAVTLLGQLREAATLESGPEQRRAVLEIARELGRLRRADHQRQQMRLLLRREPLMSERDIEVRRRAKEAEDTDRKTVKLRRHAECYRSEYVAGRAAGTLTPEREEWIEAFFDKNLTEIIDAGGRDLPEEDEEEAAEAVNPRPARPVKRSQKPRRSARTKVASSGSGQAETSASGSSDSTGASPTALTPPDAASSPE